MKHKERLDVLMVERGFTESRSKAQAMIMSGVVYVNGQKADKSGTELDADAEVEVRGAVCPYVSRGGLKLEKALREFEVDPTGFVCGESGASTGGFTDCLLQKGASKVFSIDVGYGQLAWKLRNDPRVVCMERTNLRNVTADLLGELLDLFVIDVSFISLKLVLPPGNSFIPLEDDPTNFLQLSLHGKMFLLQERQGAPSVLSTHLTQPPSLLLGVPEPPFWGLSSLFPPTFVAAREGAMMMPFSGQLSGQLECYLENVKQRKMDHSLPFPTLCIKEAKRRKSSPERGGGRKCKSRWKRKR